MKCPRCGNITVPEQHTHCLACNIDMTAWRPDDAPAPVAPVRESMPDSTMPPEYSDPGAPPPLKDRAKKSAQ